MSVLGKYGETADQQSLGLGLLGEDEESLLIDMQFLFRNHENDLNFMMMMAVQLCECIETTELGILGK